MGEPWHRIGSRRWWHWVTVGWGADWLVPAEAPARYSRVLEDSLVALRLLSALAIVVA